MNATIQNMRAHYAPGVFACSPGTGEECSANPADYWYAGQDFTLLDDDGEPMELVRRESRLVSL